MARKAQELRPVMTRIPETLRRRLERAAARNNRSMNTEIIHRLERSFRWEAVSEQLARRGTPEWESEMEPIGSKLINDKLDTILAKLAAGEDPDDGEKK
jgi:hypothetical protein